MKYLKYFENVDQSDLIDIDNMFKEYSDKWDISKEEYNDSNKFAWELLGPGKYIITDDYKGSDDSYFLNSSVVEISLVAKFLIEPSQKDEVISDMNGFINRLESIGYKIEYHEYNCGPIRNITNELPHHYDNILYQYYITISE